MVECELKSYFCTTFLCPLATTSVFLSMSCCVEYVEERGRGTFSLIEGVPYGGLGEGAEGWPHISSKHSLQGK